MLRFLPLLMFYSFCSASEWQEEVNNLEKFYPQGKITISYGDSIEMIYKYTYNSELFTRHKICRIDIVSVVDYVKQLNPPKGISIEIIIRKGVEKNSQSSFADLLTKEIKKLGIEKIGANSN